MVSMPTLNPTFHMHTTQHPMPIAGMFRTPISLHNHIHPPVLTNQNRLLHQRQLKSTMHTTIQINNIPPPTQLLNRSHIRALRLKAIVPTRILRLTLHSPLHLLRTHLLPVLITHQTHHHQQKTTTNPISQILKGSRIHTTHSKRLTQHMRQTVHIRLTSHRHTLQHIRQLSRNRVPNHQVDTLRTKQRARSHTQRQNHPHRPMALHNHKQNPRTTVTPVLTRVLPPRAMNTRTHTPHTLTLQVQSTHVTEANRATRPKNLHLLHTRPIPAKVQHTTQRHLQTLQNQHAMRTHMPHIRHKHRTSLITNLITKHPTLSPVPLIPVHTRRLTVARMSLHVPIHPRSITHLRKHRVPRVQPFRANHLRRQVRTIDIRQTQPRIRAHVTRHHPRRQQAIMVQITPTIQLQVPVFVILHSQRHPVRPQQKAHRTAHPRAMVQLRCHSRRSRRTRRRSRSHRRQNHSRRTNRRRHLTQQPPPPLTADRTDLPARTARGPTVRTTTAPNPTSVKPGEVVGPATSSNIKRKEVKQEEAGGKGDQGGPGERLTVPSGAGIPTKSSSGYQRSSRRGSLKLSQTTL